MPNDDPIDRERVAQLVKAYLEADYRWELVGDWHDVRVGLLAPGIEMAHPGAGSFGLVSAWNPWSVERTEADNRAADHQLHDLLIASDKPFRAAFASAPNRSWREPSWITMGLALDDFDALARRFNQLGTLWWLPGEHVRLRAYAERPAGFDHTAPVDWVP